MCSDRPRALCRVHVESGSFNTPDTVTRPQPILFDHHDGHSPYGWDSHWVYLGIMPASLTRYIVTTQLETVVVTSIRKVGVDIRILQFITNPSPERTRHVILVCSIGKDQSFGKQIIVTYRTKYLSISCSLRSLGLVGKLAEEAWCRRRIGHRGQAKCKVRGIYPGYYLG